MFTVQPDELADLDGLQLVELLRVLLHAEARDAGVPMRNVDAPLQITVADGGQDASVRWEDGAAATDYFPGRDLVFQCKASDGGDAAWRREVWSKASQRKAKKELNPAVAAALDRGAAYIGVTATALVGTKPAERAESIRAGIRQAGGDPDRLAGVHLYDGNKLAQWATRHPAVALWVKERAAGFSLANFLTLGQWGRRADLAAPPYVPSDVRRFALSAGATDTLGFDQLAARIVDHLADPRSALRIWGPSGIGKSRALHQALSTGGTVLRGIATSSFIFCDHREAGGEVFNVANQIVAAGSAAVLVVDACPWAEAKRLSALARSRGSGLRVVTLGTDGQDQADDILMVRPLKADRHTIRGILRQGLAASDDEIEFLAAQCDGFVRIAVLATRAYGGAASIRKSADDVAEEILRAAGIERETSRALEFLALYDHLEPDKDPGGFDALADALVHMKGELAFEHLVVASGLHLVERAGERMSATPLPIANYLALRRLRHLRPSTVARALEMASPARRKAMLARWSEFQERSETLAQVVRRALGSGPLSDDRALLGPEGDPYLAAFVHAEPNATLRALHFAIIRRPLEELATLDVGEGLLSALRLLATRGHSFRPAATLLLRLVAAAGPEEGGPLTDLLRQLYQVALAGTEADDGARREMLSAALEEDDPRTRAAVVEALGAMLTTHMTRFGDVDQIAGEGFRGEWSPASHDDVMTYFRWALERLGAIWLDDPALRPRIEAIVRLRCARACRRRRRR